MTAVAIPNRTVRIRLASHRDLPHVGAIEARSFGDPWTPALFVSHLHGDVNHFIVAEVGEHIVGYAIAHAVAGEAELLNIAVDPANRGQSIGSALLDAIGAQCQGSGATEMCLDVRDSNTSARQLYESRGFVVVGRRPRYYRFPSEDAILMRVTLPFVRAKK